MPDEQTKEQYKNDNIYELIKLYMDSRARSKKLHTRRIVLTCCVFYLMYCMLFYSFNQPDSLISFLVPLLLSAVFAFIHFAIHWSVYRWLITKNIADTEVTESLEHRIYHARDRICAMNDDEISALIAQSIWLYTDRIMCLLSIPDDDFCSIWAAVLFACHPLLDKKVLTRSVKFSVLLDPPHKYGDLIESQEATFKCYDQVVKSYNLYSQHFSRLDIDPSSALGANDLLTILSPHSSMPSTFVSSHFSEFYDLLMDNHNSIQAIFNAQKQKNKGPQFPGPIP